MQTGNEKSIALRDQGSTSKMLKRHVTRHKNLLKAKLEGRAKGAHARGRQQFKWEDNMERWSGTSMLDCHIGKK